MRPNKAKAKLARGEPIFGATVQFPSPDLVEILGYAGFDFVFIDGEHGPIDARDCENLVCAAEVAGVTPIARVPHNDSHTILRYLETGLQGIIVPNVKNADDARAMVRSGRYSPVGLRGIGMGRGAQHGVGITRDEHMRQSNDEIMLIALLEHADAVRNVQEILAVDGIDVIVVGPGDLAASLGRPINFDDPEVKAATDTILAAVIGAGRHAGLIAANGDQARAHVARGIRFIMTGTAGLLVAGTRAYFQAARSSA